MLLFILVIHAVVIAVAVIVAAVVMLFVVVDVVILVFVHCLFPFASSCFYGWRKNFAKKSFKRKKSFMSGVKFGAVTKPLADFRLLKAFTLP